MLLLDLFGYVSNIESHSLNLGGADDGTIETKYHPKVIRAINLSLLELYKEFPIKQKSLVIQLYPQLTKYTLHNDFATTNTVSSEIIKYIVDSPFEPFQNDVLKIEKVFNEDGEEFTLNNDSDELSLYTPEFNVLQHPFPQAENAIFVQYRALPVTIPTSSDPTTYDVSLPDTLLNLCLLYIGYKLLTTVNKKEASEKFGEYLLALQQAKTQSLFRVSESANEKLEVAGWL